MRPPPKLALQQCRLVAAVGSAVLAFSTSACGSSGSQGRLGESTDGGYVSTAPTPSAAAVPHVDRRIADGPGHFRGLTLLPLDQNSQFAVLEGASTGTNVTLLKNGAFFASQTIDDLGLSFAKASQAENASGSGASPSTPGNLTDSLHVVLQGTFTAGGRSELLVYDGSSQGWWLSGSMGQSLVWARVQTTPSFGNLNDGAHSWWVGDFEGNGSQQVLLYSSVDGSWNLGAIASARRAVTFGSMTWTTVANTSSLGWGSLTTNANVYVEAADFQGSGSEQVYVFDARASTQYLAAIDSAGSVMTVTRLGNPGLSSFRDGAHIVFTGAFSGGAQQQLLVCDTADSSWSLGAIDATGASATWTDLGAHGVSNLLAPTTSTYLGDFTGSGEAELMVFDGNDAWTFARMNAGALAIAAVSDWACGGCTVYAGSFSGSGRMELLAGSRWGTVASAASATLEWTELASGSAPSAAGTFTRVGHYTTATKSELLSYYPTTSAAHAGDWVRYSLDPSSSTLARYTDANTRGLPPLYADPLRLLFAGPFDGTDLDELLAYDSATSSYWLGSFGDAALALPSLLDPGDSLAATWGDSTSNSVQVVNNVSTEHHDNARSGANPNESVLTPTSVLGTGSTFSVKATFALSAIDPSTGLESGHADAQPLFVHNVPFTPPVDAVYVATQADWLYAFDAAATGAPAPLAERQLVLPGETPLPWADQNIWCKNLYPTVGIGGTPVVDAATQTLYVVARTRDASGNHHVRLHAVDLVTLQDRPASPVDLVVPGIAPEQFALLENQRAALLLDHGRVWVTFAGHCDTAPYAGYAFTFDARTLDTIGILPTVSDPSSAVSGGGIWQGGAGPASTFLGAVSGRVFMSTGNLVGTGNGGNDYSDAVVAVAYPYAQMGNVWSPLNESTLSAMDWDLSSSGVVVLPNSAILVGGKQGYLYVLDQATLQCVPPQYQAPPGCATLSPPYLPLDPCGLPITVDAAGCPILSSPGASYPYPGIVGVPAVYTNGSATTIYLKGGDLTGIASGQLNAFSYEATTRQLSRVATATTDYPSSASIVVSATNDGSAGLVWFVDHTSPGLRLVAYDMHDVSAPEKTFDFGPQPTGTGRPFVEPTVMEGRVYVGYSGGVSVLGL